MQTIDVRTDLPIFIASDQPETCCKCGTRTDFDEVNDQQQLHHCGCCGTQYLVEFDD